MWPRLLVWTGLAYVAASSAASDPLSDPLADAGGHVIIAGGFGKNNTWQNYKETEVIPLGSSAAMTLPDLPVNISGNTLTALGSILYSCGGQDDANYTSHCYTLDTTKPDDGWKQDLDLPEAMNFHSAVAVSDSSFWVVYQNMLYEFIESSNNFNKYNLTAKSPNLTVTSDHCAVFNSDDKTNYLIGVGISRDEIWNNTDVSQPDVWTKMEFENTTLVARQYSACLYLNDKIYITGGYGAEELVDIWDLSTGVVNMSPPLSQGRYGHGIYNDNGIPTVVGGYYDELEIWLNSTEVFDSKNSTWSIASELMLEDPKDCFGLAQIST